MNQPDDHLIVPAPPQGSEAIRVGAGPENAPTPPAVEDGNPFRDTDRPVALGTTLERFMERGGVSFWVLGLLISVYIMIVDPGDAFVDWVLRPLVFPIFLMQVGGLLGAVVGLMYWASVRFAPTDSQAER